LLGSRGKTPVKPRHQNLLDVKRFPVKAEFHRFGEFAVYGNIDRHAHELPPPRVGHFTASRHGRKIAKPGTSNQMKTRLKPFEPGVLV
jgi:hypothetical protein